MIFNAPTFNILTISKSHGYSLVVECPSNMNDCLDSTPVLQIYMLLAWLIFLCYRFVLSVCYCVYDACVVHECRGGHGEGRRQRSQVPSLLLSSCGFWGQHRSPSLCGQQFPCWAILLALL